jgi:formamidopyrimidine-DNA glycosylase
MPELPEVETITRQLNTVLPGRLVTEVEVLREKSFIGAYERMRGLVINRVWRRAKYIIAELGNNEQETISNENLSLVIHLKMTGQLIFDQNDQSSIINDRKQTPRIVGGHPTGDWVNALPSKHTRVIIRFADGSKLYFNDQRVFGWMKTVTSDKLQETMNTLPPDVVDPEFTVEYLSGVLGRSRRAVKLVILDQQKMGGMGNIYANDALHMAGIHPVRPANTLKKREIRLLHTAMTQVLKRGIETGGASYSHYVDLEGVGGHYQEEFVVYDKEGERCPRLDCGGEIVKMKLGGRGTYFCPGCQK